MQLCDEGSLKALLSASKKALRESQAAAAVWQALRALEYLHEKGFVHMAVCASNLLLHSSGELRLVDFKHWSVVRDWAMGLFVI